MKTFGYRSISSKLESSAKEITRCVDRISLGQSMMPLQTNSWRIPRESSSSSLFVPSISFPPASPLFATRYPQHLSKEEKKKKKKKKIYSSLYNFVPVFRDRPTLASAKFHYFSLEKGWPEIYGISASAPASG